ncbi:MAG: hypothetical protein VKS61_04930 [Candidatus Sericytochromatia bacterium]|nr:hypothetical protein [Candidatus Sericytochromatia bacterium]MEB3221402.1 hypothetical protein [Candidatus Sericytochromatia bacterium]
MSLTHHLASAGLAALLALPVPLGLASPPPAEPVPAASAVPLAVTEASVALELLAGARRLRGEARLRVPAGPGGLTEVLLHPGLVPTRLALAGRPLAWRREGARLLLALPAAFPGGVLEVAWAGRPHLTGPAGLRQDVEPRLALLRPGGGWWPSPPEAAPRLALTLTLPEGWRAIAVCPRAEFRREGRVARLSAAEREPVGLVAGPLVPLVRAGLPGWGPPGAPGEERPALPTALRARGLVPRPGLRWLELPAGYAPVACEGVSAAPRAPGPASARAAALALAPQGDFAEAPERAWLVESLAWHLAATSERGPGPAPQAPDLARDYAASIDEAGARDVPLREALSAAPSVREAVVGTKGGLAWGLLRSALGEEAFWALVKAWHAELRAGRGGWEAFAALAPQPVGWLSSWLNERGLPALGFEGVRVEQAEGQWRVMGTLAHRVGLLGVPTDLVLITEEGAERVPFRTFEARMPFTFVTRSRPLRLVLDPADRAPLVRRRHLRIRDAAEQPNAVVVQGSQGDAALNEAMRQAAEQLARRLAGPGGQPRAVRRDTELTAEERAGALILVGRPGVHALASEWADQLPVRFSAAGAAGLDGKLLWWQGRTWTRPEVGVVAAIANPLAPEQQVLLVAGLSPRAQLEALRHLRRTSTFCIFDERGPTEEGEALRPFPDLEVPLY